MYIQERTRNSILKGAIMKWGSPLNFQKLGERERRAEMILLLCDQLAYETWFECIY